VVLDKDKYQIASSIDENMLRAFKGDRSAALNFFIDLLSHELTVPERYSNSTYCDGVPYPHIFLNIFAFQDEDGRMCIPAFTNPSHAKSFNPQAVQDNILVSEPLRCRRVSGSELFQLTPDDWWIILNPNQDVAKELSPWELSLLKKGAESIPEIIEEVFSQDIPAPIKISASTDDQFKSLRRLLIEHCESDNRITKLYLSKEIPPDESAPIPMIGILVDSPYLSDQDAVLENIRGVANLAQIGSTKPKLFIGSENSPGIMLRLFLDAPPFYVNQIYLNQKPTEPRTKWGLPFFRRAFR